MVTSHSKTAFFQQLILPIFFKVINLVFNCVFVSKCGCNKLSPPELLNTRPINYLRGLWSEFSKLSLGSHKAEIEVLARASFLTGGSYGRITSRIIWVIGRIYFCEVVGLTSLFPGGPLARIILIF